MQKKFEAGNPGYKMSRKHFVALSPAVLALGGLFKQVGPLSVAPTKTDFHTENSHKKGGKAMKIKEYVLPGDRFFPESIGYQPDTGYFFVGSLENGQIVRGNTKTGEVVPFLAAGVNGMTSAAGIKLDQKDHLFVAGGYSGKIFIYQAKTAALLATFQVNSTQSVVNDFVTLKNGEVFVTDSLNPYLYKISQDKAGNFSFEQQWLSLSGTAINYEPGLNLNGITVSADEHYLIVGQTNTGKLFRIERATKKIAEIDLQGDQVLNADGIVLEGHRLYVTRNAQNLIATVQLSHDYLRGKVVATTTNPAFQFPTALAKAGEQFLIVNAQLDKEGPNSAPVLPFNVIAIELPEQDD